MLNEKGKPGLAILIASKMKGMKGMGMEDDGKDKMTEMAQEILDAVSAKDAEKLGGLLKDLITVVHAEERDSCKGEEE
jgi:hypothetical protein